MLPSFLTDPDPNIYDSDNFIVIDFETTNKDKGSALNKDNSIVLTVYKEGHKNRYKVKHGTEYDISNIVTKCEEADFIIAHNAKFELQWLVRAGLDLTKVVVFDTMIARYVLAGNRKWKLDLDSVLEEHGLAGKNKYVSLLIKNGVCPSNICTKMLTKYCVQDVRGTYELFKLQLRLLKRDNLLKVFYSRCLFTPVLADIEKNGIHVDKELVIKEYVEHINKLSDVSAELDKLTGGINAASPKQVAEFLYDVLKFSELKDRRGQPKRTGKGGRKADSATMNALKATNKKQQKFLDLKKQQSKLSAAITKTLKPLYNCVTETEDHILYANFNQCITQTHRLSSSGKHYGVQFQNFARIFKKLFNARRNDCTMTETDSAQLEFRIAVLLSQDEQGFEDILNGEDVHKLTASIIFEEEFEECEGDMKSDIGKNIRQDSKPHTFKPLYGGRYGTDREVKYYEAFRDKYKGIAAAQLAWQDEVLKNKYLVTPTGLRFHWPDIKIGNDGYSNHFRNICNYPVQMFATADVMPIAITFLWHYLRAYKLKSFFVNTVHDSAIAEVFNDEREKYSELAELSFNHDVIVYMKKLYDIEFNVPLECEISHNDHWGCNLNKAA